MNALLVLAAKGGPAMIAIIALSVVLYARCFRLLLGIRQSRNRLEQLRHANGLPAAAVRDLQRDLRNQFCEQRFPLGAMIAAAPLLGLLGTVSGMVKTFEMLAGRAGEKSMEGLARGISEVLVATESGLLVALPALLLVWLGHRQTQHLVRELNPVDGDVREGNR